MTADPLSSRAQALLDAARDGLGPDDAAIARMRANVLSGAAGGVGVAAGSAKAGMSLGGKLAILAVVAAAIGGGAWWATRDGGASSRGGGAPGAALVAETAAPPSPNPNPSPTPTPTPTPDPDPSAHPIALSEAPQGPSRKAHSTITATTIKPHAKAPSLADEVALVDDAMSALRRDDARAALAAVDDHVARFGKRGQLAEEASAIRVESLCRLGDARWSTALDTFDTKWPRSAQRPRLTAACKSVK